MEWFANRIYGVLPPAESGVLAAILLGDKSGLAKDFYENLRNTGLVHLVVVSGSNVILIVSSLIENLAWVVGRQMAILIGLAGGWTYVGMVGWEAPVIRAILLISIYYWAQLLGRKYNLVRSLGLTILVMTLADRGIVTSISFWLSMAAFVAVVTAKTVIRDSWYLNKTVLRGLLTTIWVSLWITPILALIFGKVSLIAPIANIMVVLVVEIVTIVGALAVLTFDRLMWLVYPVLRYFIWITDGLGSWRWSSVSVGFNWWMLLGWYLILFYFLLKNKKT